MYSAFLLPTNLLQFLILAESNNNYLGEKSRKPSLQAYFPLFTQDLKAV